MEVQPLEVFATDSNDAVVKARGRQFPGSVMQGDSLRHLCGLAISVARWFHERGPTDDREVLSDMQELSELLIGRLLHYQRVLEAHGIALPYSRPVTDADLVRLLPDEPDAEQSAAPARPRRDCVEFKSHPYYDDSDACDWLYLRSDDWTELAPGAEKSLQHMLRADKQHLCDLALDRIRVAAGESYLVERPYPEVKEFLFLPIGEQGYRVYIEYSFLQRQAENSPDSDFWWAIINCPYPVAPFPTGRREDYVIGLGWAVA